MNIPIYEKCDIIKRLFGEGGGSGDSHNKGWFENPEALRASYPTAENGDYAIVGSTDTVWVWSSDMTDWKNTGTAPTMGADIDLSNLSSSGESHFVKSTNLKTINNNSLIITDSTTDLPIKTYQAFPSDFVTEGTLAQVVASIKSSSGRGQGKAYLGTIRGQCMPGGSGNGECKVEYMTDNIAVLTLNSSNTPPYTWVYNTDASNLSPTPDYTWKQQIAQYPSSLPYKDAPVGVVVQYVGNTNETLTKGYFYECTAKGYNTNTWKQINIQPGVSHTVTEKTAGSTLNVGAFNIINSNGDYYLPDCTNGQSADVQVLIDCRTSVLNIDIKSPSGTTAIWLKENEPLTYSSGKMYMRTYSVIKSVDTSKRMITFSEKELTVKEGSLV